MKKLLYIIPTLLILGGISCFAINQKQEMKSRAVPQVQAKNSSITPSENYVVKYYSFGYEVPALDDDSIIYCNASQVGDQHIRIANHNTSRIIVIDKIYEWSTKTLFIKFPNYDGDVVAGNTETYISKDFDGTIYIQCEDQSQIEMYETSYQNGKIVISKITDQKTFEKIYANVLSAPDRYYDAYIGIGHNGVEGYFGETSLSMSQITTTSDAISLNNSTITLSNPWYINVRLVNSYIVDNQKYSNDYNKVIPLSLNINVDEVSSFEIFIKNDSKYTVSINGRSDLTLQPGFSKVINCNLHYNESIEFEREIVCESTTSTIEKLNVEDGDRIYVTGITPDYVKKMNAIQNFAFRIDWEENVNKTFKITIAENAMYEVPIRMSNGSIYKLGTGKSYNVSITWNNNVSNVSISEITK